MMDTAAKGANTPTDGGRASHPRHAQPCAGQRPSTKDTRTSRTTMLAVVCQLDEAFRRVMANRGAAGPDRQSIEQVQRHWPMLMQKLSHALRDGTYRPGDIRRVWIPKAGGGQRGLGIPNVVDRVVQEAVRQVLEPLYEPTFHESSHGFRPGRSCHTAIKQAKGYLEDGYEWVVDIDLENFFNKVNHQRLMAKLALRIEDKALLRLIGQMLKARVVMPDGVIVANDEGVPQGGPLSPLLSNIVLDELDWKLEERGHRFVRYADDCNIYVRSERAGHRVMAAISRYLEERLRLKVNGDKSAVAKPETRHFLGFRLRRVPYDGSVEIDLSTRTRERIDSKLRALTPRNRGCAIESVIDKLNAYTRGWIGFFGLCTGQVAKSLISIDAHLRRRLRAMQLRQWKTKWTIARKLKQFGLRSRTVYGGVYGGKKAIWALSHTSAVDKAMRNSYWDARGLETLTRQYWRHPERMVVQ